MRDFIVFAILGMGAGAAYSILGLGVVSIYQGSGVVNFAQGALAMIAAFCYVTLTERGVPRAFAMLVVLAGAALAGWLIYTIIMRQLRLAPVLASVVATLGLLTALPAAALLIWGTDVRDVPSLLPTNNIKLFSNATVGLDRLLLVAIVVGLAAALSFLYKRTTFGLATRAAAENEKGAGFVGLSPHLVAGANWALGTVLAALAGMLIAPIASLDQKVLPLLVLPALAAALTGRFVNLWIVMLAGLAIGVAQSELTQYWLQPGVNTAFPFVAVLLMMAFTGKLIPSRGSLTLRRPPLSLAGRLAWPQIVIGVGLFIVLLVTLSKPYQFGLAQSMMMATICLSVVVITGYLGQISLMQLTFAAGGAALTSFFSHKAGIPFPLPILLSALAMLPAGLVLGIPALRVRGTSLAVATVGAAIAFDYVLFQQLQDKALLIESPTLAGINLDSFQHPVRFGLMTLVIAALAASAVSNIRRSATGRRMLAVRGNERAAAVSGINVAATKLYGFALSAAIAGAGGSVIAYSLGTFSAESFAPMQSVALVTLVYIGGIATVSGGLIAGVISVGGLVYVLLSNIGATGDYYTLIAGAAVIWTVIAQPDGASVILRTQWRWMKSRVRPGSVASSATYRRETAGTAGFHNQPVDPADERDLTAVPATPETG